MFNNQQQHYGWQCPVCNIGIAPHMSHCLKCVDSRGYVITGIKPKDQYWGVDWAKTTDSTTTATDFNFHQFAEERT